MNTGFKKRPTKQDIDTFVEGANSAEVSSVARSIAYPWTAPNVREDVQRVYNLRLPEPYLLKLKYIAEQSPRSMQRFSLDVLLPAIDAEITRITSRRTLE